MYTHAPCFAFSYVTLQIQNIVNLRSLSHQIRGMHLNEVQAPNIGGEALEIQCRAGTP